MSYKVVFVGAQANEQTPNVAVYSLDPLGRVKEKRFCTTIWTNAHSTRLSGKATNSVLVAAKRCAFSSR